MRIWLLVQNTYFYKECYHNMTLYAGGKDNRNQLGIDPKIIYGNEGCINKVTRIPFNIIDVQCVTGGSEYSAILKSGSVFLAGYEKAIKIGMKQYHIINSFRKIKFRNETISWIACGIVFSLYLTESGKVIQSHAYGNSEMYKIPICKKAVAVFAGQNYGCVINEEGKVQFVARDPYKHFRPFNLGAQIVDIACCERFILIYKKKNFQEVSSLKGKMVVKLSGCAGTCAALTSDGRVFMFGENSFGQLGDGTTNNNFKAFTEVQMNEKIKDVSCSFHTLFLTESNKVFGCGKNEYCQLMMETNEAKVLSPTYIGTVEADQVVACYFHSFILSETGKLKNPAKNLFRRDQSQEFTRLDDFNISKLINS